MLTRMTCKLAMMPPLSPSLVQCLQNLNNGRLLARHALGQSPIHATQQQRPKPFCVHLLAIQHQQPPRGRRTGECHPVSRCVAPCRDARHPPPAPCTRDVHAVCCKPLHPHAGAAGQRALHSPPVQPRLPVGYHPERAAQPAMQLRHRMAVMDVVDQRPEHRHVAVLRPQRAQQQRVDEVAFRRGQVPVLHLQSQCAMSMTMCTATQPCPLPVARSGASHRCSAGIPAPWPCMPAPAPTAARAVAARVLCARPPHPPQ